MNNNEAYDMDVIERKLLAINSILDKNESGLKVEFHKVWKNNLSLPAFSVISTDKTISPNIYLNDNILNLSDEKLVDLITDIYNKNTPNISDSLVNNINSREYLLGHVIPRVVQATDFNIEGIKKSDYAYVPYENLGLIATFLVPVDLPFDDNSRASVNVSNKQLKELDVDIDTLLSHAISNITEKMKLVKMQDLLTDLMGGDEYLVPDDVGPKMYVLTTEDNHYGAAVIISEEAIARAVDLLGTEDFWLLPSSTDETIVVVNDDLNDSADEENMLSMIREINDTIVDPTMILSYSLYKHDKSGFTEIKAA